MSSSLNVNICSWNVRGLSHLKKEDVSIAFLRETDLEDKNNAKFPWQTSIDTSPPFKQAKVLTNLYNDIDYLNAWRQLHPTDSCFTLFSAPHKIYTRIDYICIPSSKMYLVLSCSIGNIVFSDHAPIYLVYSLTDDRAWSRRSSLISSKTKKNYLLLYFRI